MININTQELEEMLDIMPAEQNIMLVGKHGIGKSEILTRHFEKKGMRVVALFLGQMADPGDLLGLPTKDEKTGRTDFMPPYWFPTDGKPIVLFLDELNRARPEILQTVMDLALNRKLAGKELPEGSRIVSAVNDGEEYQLTDLDPALVSRFNVVAFRPTSEEWLLWATKNGVDKRVIGFIQNASEWLDGETGTTKGKDTGLEKTPDRRGWKKVSDMLKRVDHLTPMHRKMVASIVGVKAASQFCQYVEENKALNAADVLFNFEKKVSMLKDCELHQYALLNESLMRYLETQKMPQKKSETAVENLKKYLELLEKQECREAIAHLASLLGNKAYTTATGWLCAQATEIYMKILDYVENI